MTMTVTMMVMTILLRRTQSFNKVTVTSASSVSSPPSSSSSSLSAHHDLRYRTRLCAHWEASGGVHCDAKSRRRCAFAHSPVELRTWRSDSGCSGYSSIVPMTTHLHAATTASSSTSSSSSSWASTTWSSSLSSSSWSSSVRAVSRGRPTAYPYR